MTADEVERLRADFPILAQRVHGRPLVYLDNAATTQKPRAVIDALRRYYEEDNANTHRGVHALGDRATGDYESARAAVARFIRADHADEVVFVRGTTEAINLVAACFGRAFLRAGDEIIVSEMEHHSNLVPWQVACEQAGATLRVAPIDEAGALRFGDYERLFTPRTRLVAVTHVSNALGTVVPVREVVACAHAAGVPVLVDGAQAVAHGRVDVRALDCDFYAFSGHKLYGPTGIGVLYGKSEWLARLPPYQTGGHMVRSVSFEKTEFAPPPARFEAGTAHIAGAVGLAAALAYVEAAGIERVAAHERALLDYATARAAEVAGLRVIGTAREKGAILSFVLDGIHPHDIGTVLDRHGVAVRTGHHCAMPVMQRYGVPATTRASFALYNTFAEVDALVEAIRDAQRLLAH